MTEEPMAGGEPAGSSPDTDPASTIRTSSSPAGTAAPDDAAAGSVQMVPTRVSGNVVMRPVRQWPPALDDLRHRVLALRQDPAAVLTASVLTVGAGLAVGAARIALRSAWNSGSGGGLGRAGSGALQVSGMVEVLHRQAAATPLAQPVVQHVVHHVVHHHVYRYLPGGPPPVR